MTINWFDDIYIGRLYVFLIFYFSRFYLFIFSNIISHYRGEEDAVERSQKKYGTRELLNEKYEKKKKIAKKGREGEKNRITCRRRVYVI